MKHEWHSVAETENGWRFDRYIVGNGGRLTKDFREAQFDSPEWVEICLRGPKGELKIVSVSAFICGVPDWKEKSQRLELIVSQLEGTWDLEELKEAADTLFALEGLT